jgi:type VI secretion system secreted protein Hcp
MAVEDYFLKIDGIEGESQDSKHKNEINLATYGYGAAQTGTSATGGGGGKGRVHVKDFHFTKLVDKASPKLFQACCSGEVFKTALLTVRKAGKEQQEYYTVKLTDVLVSSWTESPDTGGNPADWKQVEAVSLNFSKIEIGYKEQKPDGTLSGEIKGGWDVKANQKT